MTIDPHLQAAMQDSADEMNHVANLETDSDRVGGVLTLLVGANSTDSFMRQICFDWAHSVNVKYRRLSKVRTLTPDSAPLDISSEPSFTFNPLHANTISIPECEPTLPADSELSADPQTVDDFIAGIRNSVTVDMNSHVLPQALIDRYAEQSAADGAAIARALGEVAVTSTEISILTDELTRRVVRARQAGAPWRQIARAAGVELSVAHRRWSKVIESEETNPRP